MIDNHRSEVSIRDVWDALPEELRRVPRTPCGVDRVGVLPASGVRAATYPASAVLVRPRADPCTDGAGIALLPADVGANPVAAACEPTCATDPR
jgi:hypothetical protein